MNLFGQILVVKNQDSHILAFTIHNIDYRKTISFTSSLNYNTSLEYLGFKPQDTFHYSSVGTILAFLRNPKLHQTISLRSFATMAEVQSLLTRVEVAGKFILMDSNCRTTDFMHFILLQMLTNHRQTLR